MKIKGCVIKMKSLGDMSCGEEGIIKKVGSSGSLRRRMIDMGMTPGAKVKLIKYAPAGDPIEIKLHDYKLSIRKSEAKEIEICQSSEEAEKLSAKLEERKFGLKEHALTAPIIKSDEDYSRTYKVALVGNPNSGKTTLFNKLTGSYQYVGNWPGVTVERKEGKIKGIGDDISLVDLPGVYSLSPYSPEEVVTRNYIINESPDVIINILDSTNLERNLYLTTQLLELDCKMILVLNMTDLLKNKRIDYKELEKRLGVPVVAVSAGKNKGIEKLLECLSLSVKRGSFVRGSSSIYSEKVENSLEKIDKILNEGNAYVFSSRFKTVKAFEGDCIVLESYKLSKDKLDEIEKIRNDVSKSLGKEKDTIIPEERYTYIYDLCQRAIKNLKPESTMTFSERIDKFLTGKFTAFPCFLFLILSIFYLTFGPLGVTLKNICEDFINTQTQGMVLSILNYIGVSPWLKSLVVDSIIKGVGAVISFLPQIVLLFTLLSLLEDCGYMARAAFIMDRPMRKIGLSGKAFVPMIMGFGCTVPAVLGSKILESKKDKNLVIFLIPFMSCSAKMPLYLLFASTFFPNHQTLVLFSLYGFGVVCACLTALLFKDTVFKGEESPFIMEVPDYKWPSFKNVRLSVWDRTKDFVERAGTVILIATVVVWFLQYFGPDFRAVSDNSQSILAKIGQVIAPAFEICGFGNWEVSVSLVTGLMAKESIVSTLSVLYAGSGELSEVLSHSFSLASAISFLVFALLYTPCVAAVSAIYKEYEDKKLAIFSVLYQLLVAYFMSALVYQFLTLFRVA